MALRLLPATLRGNAAAWQRYRAFSTESDHKAMIVARELLVDTLQLVKSFELAGLTRRESEVLARDITELIVVNKDKMCDKFVAKSALERVILEQEAKVTHFKVELQKAQDMHTATVNKDMEKQQNYLDKMRAEVRHEIDKLTASQRLDLNLEKGRMRDDLQQLRDKAMELELKMDREVNELKATVEKSKNDVIKSVIGIIGTFSAIAFTISRIMSLQ